MPNEAFSNLGNQEKQKVEQSVADELLVKQFIEKIVSLKENEDSDETRKFKRGLLSALFVQLPSRC